MKTLAETINPHFSKCLKNGIHEAPKGTKYIAVHVSTWHMRVFVDYYSNIQDVEKAIAQELIDPMCYSTVKLVWELEEEKLIFYNCMDLLCSAHNFWKENKDNPAAKEAVCVGNVKDMFPEDPLTGKDHYCQTDPGETVCYKCGNSVPPKSSPVKNKQ